MLMTVLGLMNLVANFHEFHWILILIVLLVFIYCSPSSAQGKKDKRTKLKIWNFPSAVPSLLPALCTITIVTQRNLLTHPVLCIVSVLSCHSEFSITQLFQHTYPVE